MMMDQVFEKYFSCFSKNVIDRTETKRLSQGSNTFPSIESENLSNCIVHCNVALTHVARREGFDATSIGKNWDTVCF